MQFLNRGISNITAHKNITFAQLGSIKTVNRAFRALRYLDLKTWNIEHFYLLR